MRILALSILAALTVSVSGVTITWQNTADNAEGITLERDTGGGFFVLENLPPDRTSYVDSSSVPSNVCYRVKAFNSAGESDYATGCLVDAPVPGRKPTAPTGCKVAR